jgi:hypothetical protein
VFIYIYIYIYIYIHTYISILPRIIALWSGMYPPASRCTCSAQQTRVHTRATAALAVQVHLRYLQVVILRRSVHQCPLLLQIRRSLCVYVCLCEYMHVCGLRISVLSYFKYVEACVCMCVYVSICMCASKCSRIHMYCTHILLHHDPHVLHSHIYIHSHIHTYYTHKHRFEQSKLTYYFIITLMFYIHTCTYIHTFTYISHICIHTHTYAFTTLTNTDFNIEHSHTTSS